MNRKTACFSFLALIVVISLAGCVNNNISTGPVPGQKDATMTFVEALNPPGFTPLIGFDISTVDSSGNYYLASSGPISGVLQINTGQLSTFASPTLLGAGQTSFVGSLNNPAWGVILDTAHEYEGGANGVITFYNPKAPTLTSALGASEVWAADGANFVDQASNPLTPGAYNAAYTATGEWKCNSAVQIFDTTNGEWHKAFTNGCFKADELADDPVDGVVLVANPEENASLVTNPNSGMFPSQYVPSGPASGVPTAPFISLISTVPTTPDSMGNYYAVKKQIAFDGTNGTPNANWVLIPNPGASPTNPFPIAIAGGIEQSVYSPALKKFFVAVPYDGGPASGGAIAVVNPTTYAVTKLTLTNCNPDGMALGPDGQEALLACNSSTGPQLINLNTGAMISAFAQAIPKPTDAASLAIFNTGAGNMCDEAGYNSATNEYVVACQFAYNNSLVAVIDAGAGLTGATFLQAIPTNPTATSSAGAAHSVATDPNTGAILVPLPMGDSLCPSYTNSSNSGVGCLAIWAPQGSWLAKGNY